MTNRWLLPDHIADSLPTQARQIEEVRRALLDTANSYGFELVMPPLVEHLDSLLIGAGAQSGSALDLQTFKLVDQQSGRSLGVRADITPQVARIDAHLLNRQGLTRLCYCGSVLHTRPASPHASREPLQFGAEIYGHAGLEADLEIMQLALASLGVGGVTDCVIDLSSVGIVQALLKEHQVDAAAQAFIYEALATKDASALLANPSIASDLRTALVCVQSLYGGVDVLDKARATLPQTNAIHAALNDLSWLVKHLIADGVLAESMRFDLSDLGGYGYYTGVRFAVYSPSSQDALARGGRYDEVGSVFGRKRPAVGFSLDIKSLVESAKPHTRKASIRAPWRSDASLRLAVSSLRASGETVICVLPGHESEADEFACDRELVQVGGQWVVKSLSFLEGLT
ncbi:MAG: ATP phosphoribosyltransferase regulatory subunit [Cytophagales bacterium]|nr:ATP phosphoribosyltransferase regulatory subunit [Cytophagales bacterium]